MFSYTELFVNEIFWLPNNEQNVQVSDTTGDATSTTAGLHSITYKIQNFFRSLVFIKLPNC